MIYFSKKQILQLHSSLVEKTGGIDGIRDENLLDSALNAPFQTFDSKELYPKISDKAAQLTFSLIKNHPFLDGNKRIGIHIMLVFLAINGINLSYSQQELIDLGLGIADSSISKNELTGWIEKHCL